MSYGVGFVLLGVVESWATYVFLTIAPHHAPPIVRVITQVALVIWDVAPVFLGCGLVLWLAAGIAPAGRSDATPNVVDHNAVPEATDHDAVRHIPGHGRCQQGSEENGQTSRELSQRLPLVDFGFIALVFRIYLVCGIVVGIIVSIVDIATGRFTVAVLVIVALFALGFAVFVTTLFTLLSALAAIPARREQARRRRMRHGSEPHLP
jgi:hypothetical protein